MTKRSGALILVLYAAGFALAAGEELSREDRLTQVMKDMRLAYRSFKDSLKEGDWGRMESDVKKFLDFSEKLPPLAPEEDAGPYRDNLKKFTEALRALDRTVHDRSLEGTTMSLGTVVDSCKACHTHYRNPFARFFDNLFLY